MQFQSLFDQPGPSTRPMGDYRSGPTAFAAMSPAKAPTTASKRPRTGCHTCRLRKKRCDEQKPTCATCSRLGIECLGYEKQRPTWLQADETKKKVKETLKQKIRENRATKNKDPLRSDNGGVPLITTDELQLNDDELLPAVLMPDSFGTGIVDIGNMFTAPQPLPILTLPISQAQPAEWLLPPIAPVVDQSQLNNNQLDTNSALNSALAQYPDTGFEDVWTLIFGQPPGPPNQPLLLAPSPTIDNSLLSFFSPPPSTNIDSPPPDFTYLHHYLDVVLPLQYRFVVKAMADLVTPLAVTNPDILRSTSSLAALHRAAERAKGGPPTRWIPTDESTYELEDNSDQKYAIVAHRRAVDRLRFVSADELTSEEVVLSSLFAMSYYLFMGGTAKDWPELMSTSRRSLSAALTGSPEVMGGIPNPASPSPWQRYRPLISAMVWMDIVGSVSQNKPTRVLPIYRSLMGQTPTAYGTQTRAKLSMEKVMGCDDTTFLAIAESVQLSEWRDHAEEQGSLSLKDLLHRAAPIEKLLDERSWRENTLGGAEIMEENGEGASESDRALIPILSEIFYGAAKVLLATVIHGPFPRVPEVAAAVQETAEALHRLDVQHPTANVNRSLIFPITIAGIYAESPAQQTFFRNRFATLGPDAAAFGNSKQALQLLEEVWRRRGERPRDQKVHWRAVAVEMGWESGILLI